LPKPDELPTPIPKLPYEEEWSRERVSEGEGKWPLKLQTQGQATRLSRVTFLGCSLFPSPCIWEKQGGFVRYVSRIAPVLPSRLFDFLRFFSIVLGKERGVVRVVLKVFLI